MVISKLTFFRNVQNTPDTFVAEVNKLIFDYIWQKLKIYLNLKENGGLNMIDFTLFGKALNVCWVRRLCSEGNQPWKFIPLHLLSSVGGTFLFRCSYDNKYVKLNARIPTFYKDIVSHGKNYTILFQQQRKTSLTKLFGMVYS